MMMHIVTDDTRTTALRIGPRNNGILRFLAALTLSLALLLTFATPAHGQNDGASGLTINVRQNTPDSLRVVVPVSQTIIIDTSSPIARAQTIESEIAIIQSISPTQFVITGVQNGVTQAILWDQNGQQQIIEINVELDLARLNRMLKDLDPQCNAVAKSIRGNILLSGSVSGTKIAEHAEQLAGLFLPPQGQTPVAVHNHLRIAGEHQVLLHCKVAEVDRSATRQLGFNGFMAGDDFQDMFLVNQVGGINAADIGAAADASITGTIPFLTGASGIPLSTSVPLSLGFPRVQMQLFIKAMVDNSLLRILAEPELVTVSGETASFLAGGEFPIPVPQAGSSSGAVTIEFREFGIQMNFTPLVLDQHRIRLHVAPEISETDYSTAVQIQGFVVPGLTERRVETTVEVGSGQTIAIAGLLSEEIRGLANKVPALGDVPVLGSLFRSVEYQKRNSELAIMVTPEIVAAMDPQQMDGVILPGEDHLPPTDLELYALGVLEGEESENRVSGPRRRPGIPVRVAPLASQPEELSLHGPWGYSTSNDL